MYGNRRYLRYRAYLKGDGTDTPEFSRVDVTFEGAIDSQLRTYDFDGAGNMTRKSVETWNGTSTDVVTEVRDDPSWPAADRINELNQIKRNDVTTNNVTVTWRFRWDLNGNLTKKFVGDEEDPDEVWVYVWSDENRLIRVTHSVSGVLELDVRYSYDEQGRLLTRTEWVDGVPLNPLVLEWDGWDVVRELAPDGTVTEHYAPVGEIHTFKRTVPGNAPDFYQIHGDGVGSVRQVTDSSGNAVAHIDYDAWGEELESTGIEFPLHHRFVGRLGPIVDRDTKVYCMRNRWYDRAIGQFVSRDPFQSPWFGYSAYAYSRLNPQTLVDPLGLVPREPTPEEWEIIKRAIDRLERDLGGKYPEVIKALRDHVRDNRFRVDPDMEELGRTEPIIGRQGPKWMITLDYTDLAFHSLVDWPNRVKAACNLPPKDRKRVLPRVLSQGEFLYDQLAATLLHEGSHTQESAKNEARSYQRELDFLFSRYYNAGNEDLSKLIQDHITKTVQDAWKHAGKDSIVVPPITWPINPKF